MQHPDTAIVAGAFSYTGRYVARRLLDEAIGVRTLTNRSECSDPFGGGLQGSAQLRKMENTSYVQL